MGKEEQMQSEIEEENKSSQDVKDGGKLKFSKYHRTNGKEE